MVGELGEEPAMAFFSRECQEILEDMTTEVRVIVQALNTQSGCSGDSQWRGVVVPPASLFV